MIKLRLLKMNSGGVYTLLDSQEMPSLDHPNDVNVLAVAIGKFLSKYQDIIGDPNIISSLVDTTIDTWTIKDLESIKAALMISKLRLVITDEDQDYNFNEEGTRKVMYLSIDSSYKTMGIVPVGTFEVVNYVPGLDIMSIYKKLIGDQYFNASKFLNNPVEASIENLMESKNLVGTYDSYTFSRFVRILSEMNIEIIAIILQ